MYRTTSNPVSKSLEQTYTTDAITLSLGMRSVMFWGVVEAELWIERYHLYHTVRLTKIMFCTYSQMHLRGLSVSCRLYILILLTPQSEFIVHFGKNWER